MKFCKLTPKTCQYYHLPLHRATTTAVQTAAPVPEIMDTPRKEASKNEKLPWLELKHSLD
jgi:hypothetical protein